MTCTSFSTVGTKLTEETKRISLVVEDKKIAIPGNKWYQDKFGIIRCRIFWRITYPKSSAIPFGEKSYGHLKFHANNCIL